MIEEQAKFFRALGNETRLTIIGFLLKNEHCACDFVNMSEKDQTTISRHLKILSEAGIVKTKRNGRNSIYSIKDDEVRSRLVAMGIEQQEECCERPSHEGDRIKEIVRSRYGKIATEGGSCGCGSGCCGSDMTPIQISESLGYSKAELESVPGSNLGLGCGNPHALGQIKRGETVLDLGSGAGMDAFLAAQKVGKEGKVIGIDLTDEMVKMARKNAEENGFTNVEFKLGDIEDLPLRDSSVDVILSNCVINLAPNKLKVFEEAFRVLRPGGRMYISDMVLLKDLTEDQRQDEDLISGCVGGAALRDDYLNMIESAGFRIDEVIEDEDIGKRQYRGLPVESIKVTARKPGGG